MSHYSNNSIRIASNGNRTDQSNRRNKIGVISNVISKGVTALDAAEAGPAPAELLAVTVQV